MVVFTRARTVLRHIALYVGAAAAIAYFAMHAFSGDYGIMAQRHYDERKAALQDELDRLVAERERLEARIALMRTGSLDPDMLEEKARDRLGYADPNDLVIMLR